MTAAGAKSRRVFAARRMTGVALACVALALLPWAGGTARAQDGATELTRGQSGPYEIAVVANPPAPYAGLGSRFSVHVTRAGDGAAVRDAEVHLQATWPDGRDAGRIAAPQDPQQPGWYEALLRLRQAGVWQYTVVVEGAAGAGDVSGPITVLEASTSGWSGTVLWLAALGVIVGGIVVFWWRFLRQRGVPR